MNPSKKARSANIEIYIERCKQSYIKDGWIFDHRSHFDALEYDILIFHRRTDKGITKKLRLTIYRATKLTVPKTWEYSVIGV